MSTEEAASEQLTLENMRVFAMNDCDWVAAPSREAAVAWYLRSTGGFGSVDVPVKECSLDTVCFKEAGNPEAGQTTFRALIEPYLKNGPADPFVCASTEY